MDSLLALPGPGLPTALFEGKMRKFLHQDEQIIQSTPGSIAIGISDVLWWLGNLHLTDRRVLFEHQGKIQFATRLEDIVDVKLEMRKWILQHIRQLCIYARASYGMSRPAYIAVRSPVSWQKLIKDRITFALLEGYSPCHPDPERSEEEESKGFEDSSVAGPVLSGEILRFAQSDKRRRAQNDKKRMAQSLQQGE